MTVIIETLVSLAGVYLALGAVFGLIFVFRGVDAIDPAAHGSSWRFRLLIVPGCAVFWPWLAQRWARKAAPKEERSAHRQPRCTT